MPEPIVITELLQLHKLVTHVDHKFFKDDHGKPVIKTRVEIDNLGFTSTNTLIEPVSNVHYHMTRNFNESIEKLYEAIRSGEVTHIDGVAISVQPDEEGHE